MKEAKTNAMRKLEAMKIPYTPHSYGAGGGPVDGVTVARKIGRDPSEVFKTLVTRGAGGNLFVFVIPAGRELSLKAAAQAAGEKSVAMIHVGEHLPLTGYVRGGCSPIGMKKQYRTFLDSSALEHRTILVSAGRIGAQIEIEPKDLAKAAGASFADLSAVLQKN